MKLLMLFLSTILVSCAGPFNPSGGEVGLSLSPKYQERKLNQLDYGTVDIRISPAFINYHRPENYKLIVSFKDEEIYWKLRDNIDPTHFKIHYNDHEIQNILQWEKRQFLDNKIIIPMKRFHFSPFLGHRLTAVYSDKFNQFGWREMREPICDFKKNNIIFRELASTKRRSEVLNRVEQTSFEMGVNPDFMLGLIKQESAFNSKAVSYAKALGLAQITTLAAREIQKTYPQWKTFENYSEMSVPNIKLLIMMGKINRQNDWRLDVEKNIRGSITYLYYLKEYWGKEQSQFYLNTLSQYDLNKIFLASYNSGAARVKQAIKKRQENWLNDRSLLEARRYVNKVTSYCQHKEYN